MKLILFSVLTALIFLTACAGTPSEIQREPSSITSKIIFSKKTNSASNKMLETYLKYKLIKDSGFGGMDAQDCKGYAQQNPIHCKTKDCTAMLKEQEFQCETPTCKAILAEREELCPDEICRALISNLPEKCGTNNVCISLVNQESSQCNDNKDCKAFVEKTGTLCATNKCKGIVNENLNFCDSNQN
ncbi:MAG: hypothetical protein JNL11_16905 [Bdellovibrionaceae bacterium]|nr:hypothetical protein [Pseudobdellovibrionaceae bacterium]